MILGFDKRVLQGTFQVSAEVMEELLSGTKPPAIVHGIKQSESEKTSWEIEDQCITRLLSDRSYTYDTFIEQEEEKEKERECKVVQSLGRGEKFQKLQRLEHDYNEEEEVCTQGFQLRFIHGEPDGRIDDEPTLESDGN